MHTKTPRRRVGQSHPLATFIPIINDSPWTTRGCQTRRPSPGASHLTSTQQEAREPQGALEGEASRRPSPSGDVVTTVTARTRQRVLKTSKQDGSAHAEHRGQHRGRRQQPAGRAGSPAEERPGSASAALSLPCPRSCPVLPGGASDRLRLEDVHRRTSLPFFKCQVHARRKKT